MKSCDHDAVPVYRAHSASISSVMEDLVTEALLDAIALAIEDHRVQVDRVLPTPQLQSHGQLLHHLLIALGLEPIDSGLQLLGVKEHVNVAVISGLSPSESIDGPPTVYLVCHVSLFEPADESRHCT